MKKQTEKPKDLIARYFSAIIEGLVRKVETPSPLVAYKAAWKLLFSEDI